MNKFTFIIKTHERPKSLLRLLSSLEKYYPNETIIIADDSKRPYRSKILKRFPNLNIEYIISLNRGINFGRNLAAKRVNTDYFVLLDDDYIITPQTNITSAMDLMESKKADLICGITNDILDYSIVRIIGSLKRILINRDFSRLINLIKSKGTMGGWVRFVDSNEVIYYKYDDLLNYENPISITYGPNFFVMKTSILKKINYWNEDDHPPIDHSGFFVKLEDNGVRVILDRDFQINHISTRSIKYYFLRKKRYYK